MGQRTEMAFLRFDQAELRFCQFLNRSISRASIRRLFRVVSWLGDGWLWYALILSLPLLYGREGWIPAVHMALTGFACVYAYRLIKRGTVRERPYITHAAINAASAPLDRYSFPSGHTLHAVSFTIVMTHYFPEWAGFLVAFAALVALSRVILGLHYPTDVLAGAVLGGVMGTLSIAVGQQIL